MFVKLIVKTLLGDFYFTNIKKIIVEVYQNNCLKLSTYFIKFIYFFIKN